jgi:hypothetical protein
MAVLDALQEHEVRAAIIRVAHTPGRPPREAGIRTLARLAVAEGAGAVVLDRDESVEALDKRWLYEELHKAGVTYKHLRRHEDPLLWAADGIAWSWQRGSAWRERVEDRVFRIIDVAP